jgi:hypothetical protein
VDERFVRCPGSRTTAVKAVSQPAPDTSKKLMLERGVCPLCGRYYTIENGKLPTHGFTRPKRRPEAEGQLSFI